MIAKADEFIAKNLEAIASVDALKAAIDGLDDKTIVITVKYVTEGNVPSSLQAATQIVRQQVIPATAEAAPVTQVMDQLGNAQGIQETNDALERQAGLLGSVSERSAEAANTFGILSARQLDAANAALGLDRDISNFVAAYTAANEVMGEASGVTRESAAATQDAQLAMLRAAIAASQEAAAIQATREGFTAYVADMQVADELGRSFTETSIEEAAAQAAQAIAQARMNDYLIDYAQRVRTAQENAAELVAVEAEQQAMLASSAEATRAYESGMLGAAAAIQQARNVTVLADEATAKSGIDMLMYAGAAQSAAGDTDGFARTLAAAHTAGAMLSAALDDGGLKILQYGDSVKAAGGTMTSLGFATFREIAGLVSLGQIIHGVVGVSFEFLATAIPAAVAAAAAAWVMYQGVMEQVVPHQQALYTSTEALGGVFNMTAGDILGTGHAMQAAQNAANPLVYTMYGAAISIARQNLHSFAGEGLQVTQVLTDFSTKVQMDLQGSLGTTLNTLISKAVQDLVEFGQILGNLGHGFLNLAADMPGLAEALLRVLDGVSGLFKAFSGLPAVLLTLVMGIEEAYRWSGYLAGIFSILIKAIGLIGTLGIPVFIKIGENFANMGAMVIQSVANMVLNIGYLGEKFGVIGAEGDKAMGKVIDGLTGAANFMKGPWGAAIGLAAVGFAALIIWAMQAKTATDKFVESEQKAVANATNLNALNVIYANLGQNTNQLADAQTNLADQQLKAGDAAMSTGRWYSAYQQNTKNAAGAVSELTKEQNTLIDQGIKVVEGGEQIATTYGTNLAGGLAIADLAGVKLSSSMNMQDQMSKAAQIQIANLVLGYKQMDQQGSVLTNSMQAVYIQTELQNTQVQKLNSAWDQFVSNSSGLISAFTNIQNNLAQMGNVEGTLGGKIANFTASNTGAVQLSVTQISNALKTFQGTSAQVWQNYISSVQSAEQFTDQLRVAAASGAVSQTQYGQAIATVAAQYLPYAAHSQAAASILDTIIAQGGGPVTSSFSNMKKWIDSNSVSTNQMNGFLTQTTVKMSNVTQAAQQFASTLQSDVVNAVANAGASTAKITSLTNAYVASLEKNGTQSQVTGQAQQALTAELGKYGVTATTSQQIESQLSQIYAKHVTQADNVRGSTVKLNDSTANLNTTLGYNVTGMQNAGSAADTLKNSHLTPLAAQTDGNKNKLDALGKELGETLPGNLGTANSALDGTKNSHLQPLEGQTDNTRNAAQKLGNYYAGTLPGQMGTGNSALDGTKQHAGWVETAFHDVWTWAGNMARAIVNLPTSHSTTVNVSGHGGTSISSTIAGVAGGIIKLAGLAGLAEGGVLPGFAPGHDTIPAMLSPGEGILTPHAVKMLGGEAGINSINSSAKHFAEGGLVGTPSLHSLPDLSTWATQTVNTGEEEITASFQSVLNNAVKTEDSKAQQQMAQEAKQLQATMAGIGSLSASAKNIVGLMQSAAAALMGWTGAQWQALYNVEMREAGFSLTATNPTSGAYGLAQFINGPSEYAQYGGSADTADGQIVGMLNYVKSRYGTPSAAWAHELAYGWYDQGGMLMPGMTLAYNGTGQPEKITSPSGGGGGEGYIHNVINLDGKTIWENMQQRTLRYNSRNSGNGNITGAWRPS